MKMYFIGKGNKQWSEMRTKLQFEIASHVSIKIFLG